MVVKDCSVNANKNTLLVALATFNVHLTPVKLIELCFNSQNTTWTLKNDGKVLSRQYGQETIMRNCFFLKNQEVMLVMSDMIIFLDKNL